jgi:glycosyltransferase EpsE
MYNPLISVIMSVYNDELFLRESIESILTQSFKDFEFIIINDASTDNCLEIIKEYQKSDRRIKIINHEKNEGLARSLNDGILISRGRYIARHDSDDIALTNRLSKQIDYVLKNPHIKLLGSSAIKINENGEKMGEIPVPLTNQEIIKHISRGNPFIHPSVIIDKEALINIGMYDENIRRTQDYELWFRMLTKYQCSNLNEVLLLYRINSNGMSKKKFKYRILESKIRYMGIKKLGLSKINLIFSFKPILVGLIPKKILYRYYLK